MEMMGGHEDHDGYEGFDSEPTGDQLAKKETPAARLVRIRWTRRDVFVSVLGVAAYVIWTTAQPSSDWHSWAPIALLFAVLGLIPAMLAFVSSVYYSNTYRLGRWVWHSIIFLPWVLSWIFDGRPFWGQSLEALLAVYFACATYLFFRGFWAFFYAIEDMLD